MQRPVLVVIGVGGMGLAIARRLGSGKTVLLADFDERTLGSAQNSLSDEGFHTHTQTVDVSSRASVAELARIAAGLGPVMQVAHTAGLSPTQASSDAIWRVDLLGVALVLEHFGAVVADGGAAVVIASMAAYMLPALSAEHEHALAAAAADQLLELPFVKDITEPGYAYSVAKQANHVLIRSASSAWGTRGARVNGISPGVICTPMGQTELASPLGEGMRAMVSMSAAQRLGTPEDIAGAAAFLLSPDASFITGADLLVDGGVVAAVKTPRTATTAHPPE